MEAVALTLALLFGWALDRSFGDVQGMPHLIVGFGKMISAGEKSMNKGRHRILKGGVMAVLLIAGVFFAVWGTLLLAGRISPWLSAALAAVLIYYCLAGKTLSDEVRDVFRAADRSLEEGRRQVSRIVGRDTANLSDRDVRIAALETLAENLSDGVVAPLFWLAVGGVPGMAAYKMVNTLDSMIGYRSERYRLFGRVAARIDDVANWIPARLTALLMVLVAGCPGLIPFVLRYGPQHASPNSGWPEAALAGILDCRFGGTHDYFGEAVYKPYIGENPREVASVDMEKAVRINLRTEIVSVLLAAAVFTAVALL